eukprot:502168-Hanusia_phi.AAC.1
MREGRQEREGGARREMRNARREMRAREEGLRVFASAGVRDSNHARHLQQHHLQVFQQVCQQTWGSIG